MSVIAALIHKGKIYIASDGRACLNDRRVSDDIEKVAVNVKAGVAVGAVGDLCETQRILYGLNSGEISIEKSGKGYTVVDNGTRTGNASAMVCIAGNGNPVIATRDHAWGIIDAGKYACIGDGNDVAAGAIEMAIKRGLVDKNPKAVVKDAVEIAAKISVNCGGKIRTYVL